MHIGNVTMPLPSVSMLDTIANEGIRGKIYSWVAQKPVYHAIFWTGLLLLLVVMDRSGQNFWNILGLEIINVGFHIAVVYFNLGFLIPKYLTDKKFFLYCLLLILTVILITPIKVAAFLWWFQDLPGQQALYRDNQYGIFLSTFLIAGSSTIVRIVSDWLKYQRDRKELQTQTMQSELKFLKSQINPHFLFNTLNSLYALTLKKSDDAPQIVIKLSEMMRYMLYECNERWVMLSKEVNYLRNYLDLERLRQQKNVDIQFFVRGHIGEQRIAPLLLIPFLENSFKHGLNSQLKDGFVHISLEVQPDHIQFEIENSKAAALPQATHKRSGGIGLVNVRRRLDLLYPGKYELDIRNNPNTYHVTLTLNLL